MNHHSKFRKDNSAQKFKEKIDKFHAKRTDHMNANRENEFILASISINERKLELQALEKSLDPIDVDHMLDLEHQIKAENSEKCIICNGLMVMNNSRVNCNCGLDLQTGFVDLKSFLDHLAAGEFEHSSVCVNAHFAYGFHDQSLFAVCESCDEIWAF